MNKIIIEYHKSQCPNCKTWYNQKFGKYSKYGLLFSLDIGYCSAKCKKEDIKNNPPGKINFKLGDLA